jgi:hypothetical protein
LRLARSWGGTEEVFESTRGFGIDSERMEIDRLIGSNVVEQQHGLGEMSWEVRSRGVLETTEVFEQGFGLARE